MNVFGVFGTVKDSWALSAQLVQALWMDSHQIKNKKALNNY